jgi:hypothetical protein
MKLSPKKSSYYLSRHSRPWLIFLCVSNLSPTCKISVPPYSFPLSRVSLFECFIPTIFSKCFKSCSCPSTTHHHLPHYSWFIMVLTQRSIISQPNRVYTHSCSSLVPVLFSLSKNNTSSYYSIDRRSGFPRVCYDCTIFFLFHINLIMSNLFWIIDRYGFH